MPGTVFGIMDALGFIIVASVLFFPVVWFGIYFMVELIRLRRPGPYRIVFEDPGLRKKLVVPLDKQDVDEQRAA